MNIALNWPTIWGIITTVVTIASVGVALIPAPATGPLAILHKIVQIAALAVGNAKVASPNATPSVGEVVKDVVEASVANTTVA